MSLALDLLLLAGFAYAVLLIVWWPVLDDSLYLAHKDLESARLVAWGSELNSLDIGVFSKGLDEIDRLWR